jgi:hypothetical protein
LVFTLYGDRGYCRGAYQVIERIGAIVLFGQQVHNFCDNWQLVFGVVNKKTDKRAEFFDNQNE